MEENNKPNIVVQDEEIALIKSVFADNDELLQAMRALFFGLEIKESDKKAIEETFASDALMKIIQKRFLPTLNAEAPIGQVSDVWLGAETMIFGASQGTIAQAVLYKERSIDMTRRALALLRNTDGERISLEVNGLQDELGVDILARNQFIRHIESQLLFLKIIAGTKDESPEDAKKRLAQNSSQ